jgi:hypothetical protein
MFHEKKFLGFLVLPVVLFFSSCTSNTNFTSNSTTQFFTQGFNPPYLDVLWTIDNRSPMYPVAAHLTSEASNFFTRLDALTTTNYRMATITTDMQFAKGALQPEGTSNQIITQNEGTLAQRVAFFGDVIDDLLINLTTGYADEGFDAAYAALTGPFQPLAGVPLVLVFISDSDDHSTAFQATSPNDWLDFYANEFLALKGNDASLLQVYSINLTKNGARCTNDLYGADIDSPGFENRYFGLADDLNGSTADLCGPFSSQINLNGLQLTTLPTSFALTLTPNPNTIDVSVYNPTNQQPYNNLTWTYSASTNSIVFASAPPDGATIQVTFHQ